MKLYNGYTKRHLNQIKGICSVCGEKVNVTMRGANPRLVARLHWSEIHPLGDMWNCAGSNMEVFRFLNIPCWICRKLKMHGNVPAGGPARKHLVCCKHYRIFYAPNPLLI